MEARISPGGVEHFAQDQRHLPLFSKRSRIRKIWELAEMQQSREQLTKICGEVILHNISLRTGELTN